MLAYPLTEKAFRAMVAEMAQRRAGGSVAVDTPESPSNSQDGSL